MELTQEGAIHALARLVPVPEPVAERLDDVIRRDTEVRGAGLEHLQHGMEDPVDRAEWRILPLVKTPQAVEMAEQLVGAVHEVHDHFLECYFGGVDFGVPRSSR
jgi:hypothetical protein